MSFHNVIFPDRISVRSEGGPGFSTSVTRTASGARYAVSRWPQAKRTFNVRFGIKNHDDVAEVLNFYVARDGPANGFLFKDWSDYSTNSSRVLHIDSGSAVTELDMQIGIGDGSSTQFQLVSLYEDAASSRTRTIRKPKSGTVLIAVDGVAKTEGVDYSVDTSTGIVTFIVAPTNGAIITAGCEFYVPVAFDKAVDAALKSQFESFNVETLPDIPLEELINDVICSDERPMGGGQAVSLVIDTMYDYEYGVFVALLPQVTGVKFYLPAIADLDFGGPHVVILNEHASKSAIIYDVPGGTALRTLDPGDWGEAWVYDNGGGSKKWGFFGN